MIDAQQLLDFCADLESDRIERTISMTNTEKFCEAICAFANDMPNNRASGFFFIGVYDNGARSGLRVTDQLLQNLAAIHSAGNVLPSPVMNVYKVELQDGDVAVVEVTPSDLPPVRYRGRVYIRIGPSKRIANEQEERILSERRVANARTFDAKPCAEAAIRDLAMGQFDAYRRAAIDEEILLQNNRAVELQLASLRFYDVRNRCPTIAGILLFGANPRYFLPGAYIQYLSLPGNELVDVPEDQAEISGDLLTVLREIDVRIRTGVQTKLHTAPDSLQDELRADYPVQAIREFIMNAVMHRNYESNTPIRFYWFADRIEIQNPGGLYGEATPENFPNRNSYRNPIIAEAMKELGYVNRFGYGVTRAMALLRENGNPEPQFEFDAHSVLVKIMRRPL